MKNPKKKKYFCIENGRNMKEPFSKSNQVKELIISEKIAL